MFNFNTESNIPTFYSSVALLIVSILLSIIALAHKRLDSSYFHWLGLAVIFLFLSFDEITVVHEGLIAPVRQSLNTTGLLYNAWVILYGIALMVFAITYLKFLMSLPKKIMILFVVSGTTYVAGVIGFELLGGWLVQLHGSNNMTFSILYTCEEFFEMFGIVIFIYTLLLYMASQFKFLTISINEERID